MNNKKEIKFAGLSLAGRNLKDKVAGRIFYILLFSLLVLQGCGKHDLKKQEIAETPDDPIEFSTDFGNSASNGNASDADAPTPDYKMTLRSIHVTSFDRDGTKLMQMGNYMYSLGGWTASPEQSYHDVYRSSGTLSNWKKLPNAPWHGRHTFGIAKIDSTLYVFGGDYIHNIFDVWKSTDGDIFSKVANNLKNTVGSRLLYGACAHNNQLFVLGGQANLGLNSGLKDVWSSPDGISWTKIASNKGFLGKNISGCVASFNGKIWVIGGGYYNHPNPLTRWTSRIYGSTDGINWKRYPDAPWKGRQYADVCVWDNKLWMIGGNNGPNQNDIWYMKKNGTWVQFEVPPGYIGRHATGVGVYKNKLVITCGNYNNDCWVIQK